MTKTIQIVYDSRKRVWRLPDGTETSWFPSDFLIANEKSKTPLDVHLVGLDTPKNLTGRESMSGMEYYKRYYVRGVKETRREEVKEEVKERRRVRNSGNYVAGQPKIRRGRPVGSKNKPKLIIPSVTEETTVRRFVVKNGR